MFPLKFWIKNTCLLLVISLDAAPSELAPPMNKGVELLSPSSRDPPSVVDIPASAASEVTVAGISLAAIFFTALLPF